jgi:hypothetical protein
MARRHDDDDEFDDDEVLRDGHRLHVRMMQDGLVPVELSDGTTARLAPWQHAALIAARHGLADDGSMALHRPGPRYAADQAGFDAKAQAYAEMIADMENAWRKPPGEPADVVRELCDARKAKTNDEREVERKHNTGNPVADAYMDQLEDLTTAWVRKR